MILKVQGVAVGSKNRSKNVQKMRSRWEGILASIFHGFWSIFETMLAPSWDRKSIKNRSKKVLKNRWQKEVVLEASGQSSRPPGEGGRASWMQRWRFWGGPK